MAVVAFVVTKRVRVAIVLAALAVVPLQAVPPVRTMYGDAMAKEQSVRAVLAGQQASESVLTAVRAVVAAYEAVVWHYPTSGYSDNALWQAGRLSLDAFEQFRQAQDKTAGIRLLRTLAKEYPTSALAKQVPDQLAAVKGGLESPPLPAKANPPGADVSAGTGLQAGPSAVGTGLQTGPSPKAPKIATITDIRRAVLPDAIRVIIELDAEVPFHEERITGPARIFVDFSATRAAASLVDQTIRFDAGAEIVRQVRIGRHPNNTTRVVLDAVGVSSYSVYPLYSPFRLVVDCVRATAVPALTAASSVAATPAPPIQPVTRRAVTIPTLASRHLDNEWGRRLPAGGPTNSAALGDAYAAPIADPAGVLPASPPPHIGALAIPAPATSMGGGFSMARQLGLGVSRIVIDPGHGGHDPGAQGKGVTEAELVLDVALQLEKLLENVPDLDVILTRRTDEFIPLPERTAIANREGADLFLSIHVNASLNNQARGVETYFLNFANNLSAAAVAARENAASGQAMGALPDLVKAIALNNKLDESRDFAALVQRSMTERLRASNKAVKNLGVKQAPFVVLIGASMPSVLAEISFLSNAQEAKLLKSHAYRQRIAEALASAIRTYQTSLRNVRTVAQQ